MEHLVRVLNERDRRTLEWLRMRFGDAAVESAARSIGDGEHKPYVSRLCKELGVKAPVSPLPRRIPPTAVAEQSLATMKTLLAAKAVSGRYPVRIAGR
jgi:hypothetical protein